MNKLYQIKDWDGKFENHKSRTTQRCGFCCVPNKQDGLGYGMIIQDDDGPAIYGAFVAILLMCSKQPSPRKGYLTDTGGVDGRPLGSKEISVKTRMPSDLIEKALRVTSSPEVDWIDEVTSRSHQGYRKGTGEATKEGRKEEKELKERTTEPAEASGLLSKHPEFQQIKDCEPLSKMTIERYIAIKHAFPKVKAPQAIHLACLKATAPETTIHSLDGFLRTQFQYAPEADKREIPYALGGLQIRLNGDGSRNEDDHAAFRKAVC